MSQAEIQKCTDCKQGYTAVYVDENDHSKGGGAYPDHIELCSLHASAGQLREAVRQIGQVARRKLVGREAGAEARQVIRAIADAALAASEGKV